MGALTRAQVYTSCAYGLATGVQPRLRLSDHPIAGLPARVRLSVRGAALRGHQLAVTSACLLDANGQATAPGEITLEGDAALVRTKPSLRDDLYLQVVCQVQDDGGDLPPIAVATDLRPAPSVSMAFLQDGVWAASRGEGRCRLMNHLLEPVSCRLKLEVPEGYQATALQPVTLAAGGTADVPIEVTSDQAVAPPGASRVILRLDPAGNAGEVSADLVFRPIATCPRITAPTLDGQLDDPAWQQAARLGPFVLVGDGSAPKEPTHALIGRDDDYLYVAFECMESSRSSAWSRACWRFTPRRNPSPACRTRQFTRTIPWRYTLPRLGMFRTCSLRRTAWARRRRPAR